MIKKYMLVGLIVNSSALWCMDACSLRFIKAAHEGDLKTIKEFVSRGIDLDVKDEQGSTALHKAASRAYITSKYSAPNVLHKAAEEYMAEVLTEKRLAVLRYLINAGADVHAVDLSKRSALVIARATNNEEAIHLLMHAISFNMPLYSRMLRSRL